MRWRLILTAVALGILASGTPATAAPAGSPAGWATSSELDQFLQEERTNLKLSGLAVVVLSQGDVIFEKAYGDAAPGGPAVTLDTPFVLGSTSKQFTALAIQQLIAKGKLSLDDRVGELLASLGGDTSRYSDVTVEQLLSHTSGLSTNAGTADVFDPAPAFTSLEAEARQLLQDVPVSRPGSKFEYSNANYSLLGAIIEQVTGLSFEEALQDLVAKPLGLGATTSDLSRARADGLAVGHYTWFGAMDSTTPGPRWSMGAPSAYTASSAADLTRLLQAELGQPSGVAPDVFAADHVSLAVVNEYSKYASGWYVRPFWELHDRDENYDDPSLPLIYEHDGDTTRETSYLAFSPDDGFGVVVLSNMGLGTDRGRFADFTYQLLHKIVGTEATPRSVDPLISAAPVIMVALPLLQLAVLVLLAVTLRRSRRVGRWIVRGVAALVTILTLLVAFAVVPGQTHQPLFDRAWWSSVPDLAVSVGVSLLFAAACGVVAVVGLFRAVTRRSLTRRP